MWHLTVTLYIRIIPQGGKRKMCKPVYALLESAGSRFNEPRGKYEFQMGTPPPAGSSASSPSSDNEGFVDPALTPFILEVRDVTFRQSSAGTCRNKRWKRTRPMECLALLESAGVIDTLWRNPRNPRSIA